MYYAIMTPTGAFDILSDTYMPKIQNTIRFNTELYYIKALLKNIK